MKIYVMKCGCRRIREELTQVGGLNTLRCPDHLECKTDYIEIACIDCGATVIANYKAPSTIRCETCRIKHRKKKQRKADAKRRNPDYIKNRQALEKSAADAWDCVNRGACMDKTAKDPHAEFLPCHKCDRYMSASVDAA